MRCKSKSKITILFTLLVFLVACQKGNDTKVPDVTHIEVTLQVDRFEQDLFALDTNQFEASVNALHEKYPVFAPCYFEDIIGIARPGDTNWLPQLERVLAFPGFRAAFDSVQVVYADLEPLTADLTQAFRYHQYYLPEYPIPTIRTFTSEYGYGAVACSDTVLGVGLDLFLGSDFSFYRALQFPQYLIHRMNRDHILPSIMQVYWQSFLAEPRAGASLLDQMLYYGKLHYYLDLVLPFTDDALKIGYTDAQVEWAETHEEEIWAYLLDKDRLFDTNYGRYAYLINEGPSTQGMPIESPGKIGQWVGWQMVRTYRLTYPEEPLSKLWAFTDGQAFLERSGYKPGR